MTPEKQNGDRFETQSPPLRHHGSATQNGTPMTRESHVTEAEKWLAKAEQYWERQQPEDAALAVQFARAHTALASVAQPAVVRYVGREAQR